MRMEEVFGLGLGAGSGAHFPLPVFRAFRRAHYLHWARLFKPNVGQAWIVSTSAATHLRVPRFAPQLPHTKPTSTSSSAPTKEHFTERVSLCINIVQPLASCNSKRWCKQRTKIVRHSTLAATMHASVQHFDGQRPKFRQRGLFASYARTFARAGVSNFRKYWHPVAY